MARQRHNSPCTPSTNSPSMAAERTYLFLSFRHSTMSGIAVRIPSCNSPTNEFQHIKRKDRDIIHLVLQALIVPQWQQNEHTCSCPLGIPQCLELLFESPLAIHLQTSFSTSNGKTET